MLSTKKKKTGTGKETRKPTNLLPLYVLYFRRDPRPGHLIKYKHHKEQ